MTCDVVVSDCGPRDLSYDDAGGVLPPDACVGALCPVRPEPSAAGGIAVLLFLAVIFGWLIVRLRRYWARPLQVERG